MTSLAMTFRKFDHLDLGLITLCQKQLYFKKNAPLNSHIMVFFRGTNKYCFAGNGGGGAHSAGHL